MSKRKRPNSKTLRQGQTIYGAWVSLSSGKPVCVVDKIFISGVDVPDYCVVTEATVKTALRLIKSWPSEFYYSRRKAQNHANQINKQIKKWHGNELHR
jgi:hypothetical protein